MDDEITKPFSVMHTISQLSSISKLLFQYSDFEMRINKTSPVPFTGTMFLMRAFDSWLYSELFRNYSQKPIAKGKCDRFTYQFLVFEFKNKKIMATRYFVGRKNLFFRKICSMLIFFASNDDTLHFRFTIFFATDWNRRAKLVIFTNVIYQLNFEINFFSYWLEWSKNKVFFLKKIKYVSTVVGTLIFCFDFRTKTP